MRRILAGALLATLLAVPGAAKDCARKERPALATACAEAPRPMPKPYDPREERSREPGVIDLGNGTTVRVRGSVRTDVDRVRR